MRAGAPPAACSPVCVCLCVRVSMNDLGVVERGHAPRVRSEVAEYRWMEEETRNDTENEENRGMKAPNKGEERKRGGPKTTSAAVRHVADASPRFACKGKHKQGSHSSHVLTRLNISASLTPLLLAPTPLHRHPSRERRQEGNNRQDGMICDSAVPLHLRV